MSNRLAWFAAFTLLAGLLAGCFSSSPREAGSGSPADPSGTFEPFVPPAPDFDFAGVVEPDHAGHNIPSMHTAGHGLTLTGHTGVQDILPTTTRGSITAVDIWQDYAVVSGMEGGLAFAIVDLSDPANPNPVGWAPSAADGWTARFSDDGNYVFYGCQIVSIQSTPTNTGHVLGTCEDPSQPHLPHLDPAQANPNNPAGVSVWDVSDKTDPKFVTFTATGGSHNIFVTSINGEDYVFTSAVTILHFDRANKTLDLVDSVPGRHDATVARHPITGQLLLFTGTGELSIYDVSDPSTFDVEDNETPPPVYLGDGDQGWRGWHDQVLVPGVVDGRVILLLAGETSSHAGGEVLPDIITVVDVTDPTTPVKLSEWQPPFRPALQWRSYLYSVHEMAATPQGQVAIAWYHAGVWVIDVSTQERQSAPVTLAAYQPHEAINVVPSTFVQTPLPYVPFVWAAGWNAEGYLVVPDMHTGLYMLKPDWGLHPALDSGQ